MMGVINNIQRNRIIIFNRLSKTELKKIVDIQLGGLHKRLAERHLELVVGDDVKDRLTEDGFDPVYGARPLKRALQRLLENPLAVELLQGKFPEGSDIIVKSGKDGKMTFDVKKPVAAAAK